MKAEYLDKPIEKLLKSIDIFTNFFLDNESLSDSEMASLVNIYSNISSVCGYLEGLQLGVKPESLSYGNLKQIGKD